MVVGLATVLASVVDQQSAECRPERALSSAVGHGHPTSQHQSVGPTLRRDNVQMVIRSIDKDSR